MGNYAPLYSKQERIRLALLLVAIFLPLLLLSHFWIIPWITAYVPYANCYRYGDYNGVEVLLYAAFVAFPLAFALLLALLLGPRSLRILRAGQDPLPGEKVLRKTRYRHGSRALLLPAILLLLLLALLAMALWGSFQVDKLAHHVVPCSEQQKSELGIGD